MEAGDPEAARLLGRIKTRRWFRERRMDLFYIAIILPSFLAFTPLVREIGFFYYFLFSLLAIIIVYQDKETFESLPLPTVPEVVVGAVVMAFAFVVNWYSEVYVHAEGFGQTDYVILLAGIILVFFGYTNIRKIFVPLALVTGARLALVGLDMMKAAYLTQIAGWFVGMTISTVRLLGYGPAQLAGDGIRIISYGPLAPPGGEAVNIAWGCTGLSSLVIFSFIITSLILSYKMSYFKKGVTIAVGIIGSFLVNILRLVMLSLILYHRGLDEMLWVHRHIGDVLFVIWIAAYWAMMFKFVLPREGESRERNGGGTGAGGGNTILANEKENISADKDAVT